MKKRLTIFMVMCVFALSGFVSVITSNKNTFAEESTDTQLFIKKIEVAKSDIKNKQAYLENLLQKAKIYISNEGKGISPAVQAKKYLNKLGTDSIHIEEFKAAIEIELKHIEDLAAKKYKGDYVETPELTNIKKKLSNSALALKDEENYISHVKKLQSDTLSEKDLNKAKIDAEKLKDNVNIYIEKMQNDYADSFILANEFKNVVNDLADKTVQEVYRKLDEKQKQNSSELKASELSENQISKKDNKQIQTLQAPNTGEKNNNFELIEISFAATLLTALSVVVLKKF